MYNYVLLELFYFSYLFTESRTYSKHKLDKNVIVL